MNNDKMETSVVGVLPRFFYFLRFNFYFSTFLRHFTPNINIDNLPMNKRTLGNTNLSITTLGFGAWAAGGPGWEFSWGPQDDRDSIAAMHRAIDLGVNWIDTAAVYGLGHSEEVVAKALKGMAERPYIFTKCAQIWDEKGKIIHSINAASVRKECESSLRRLQVETIDLYQIHWPIPDEEIEEGWRTLVDLKREGKVRYIGVSNFTVAQLERAARVAPVSSLQPPYSLARPEVEKEILPYCEKHGIGVIVYAPMMSGLLTGTFTKERMNALAAEDHRHKNPQFHEPRLSRNLLLVEELRRIGKRHGASPGEVAIAWTLRLSAVTGAIVGGRSPAQVEGTIRAATLRLEPDDFSALEAFQTQHP